jgi:hypothetical protein
MFCPNCGSTVNKKLKYCNSCGERFSKAAEIDKDGTPGKMLDNILTTLFLVVMFGFGILVGLVAVMLGNDVRPELVAIIVVAYLAAIFGICGMLAWQVPKLINAKLKAIAEPDEPAAYRQLQPLTTGQLEEYREPVGSVTDRTTRTLDPVPLKRD